MKTEMVRELTKNFEDCAHKTEQGIEFWFARDLQSMLGYTKWENFQQVIIKAKQACEGSGHKIFDHFPDVRKMVKIGSGSEREIEDIMLTRYACYLIAQNGDPQKPEIAFAQTYFAIQTRKAELIEQKLLEAERVLARKKLSETEKELSRVIFEQTHDDKSFAIIRSEGDKALFGKSTSEMKTQWNVPANRPLADFSQTIILKAKDFAAEITIFNAKAHSIQTQGEFSKEHITNNQAVRDTLVERGIHPEALLPAEDVKKVERRLSAEKKKALKEPENL